MIVSRNPYTGEEIESFEEFSQDKIEEVLDLAFQTSKTWKQTSFKERAKLLLNTATELRENKNKYARTITLEMGKPITQSIAEVEKCAWVCEYYAENAEQHLADEHIKTDALKSYVSYEPIGVVLAVMPWNYPLWQVFRFAAPALAAGNIGILKHASNVMQCAINIENIFKNAGFPPGCFQNLVIGSDKVENILKDKRVKAVTLTGSKPAGSAVASAAASEIKKSVLELGGSNALVVFKDAPIESTIETCIQARFQNTGQSCIAGKRLILHKDIANQFLKELVNKVGKLKSGDPLDKETFIGVMAREDLAKELEEQVQKSVKDGASILLGGKRKGTYFEPTIIQDVKPGMAVFKEETFGPVLSVTTFDSPEEAIDLVNSSEFGLGVSLFTKDIDWAEQQISKFEDGAVFINDLVKSDPRLPFGGTKTSGYGRELSIHGIREFLNKKTVYINRDL